MNFEGKTASTACTFPYPSPVAFNRAEAEAYLSKYSEFDPSITVYIRLKREREDEACRHPPKSYYRHRRASRRVPGVSTLLSSCSQVADLPVTGCRRISGLQASSRKSRGLTCPGGQRRLEKCGLLRSFPAFPRLDLSQMWGGGGVVPYVRVENWRRHVDCSRVIESDAL